MKKWIVGNWKMHGLAAGAHALVEAVAEQAARLPENASAVVCPPAVLLTQIAHWLVGSRVRLGGQDCHAQAEGAFTGNISAPMLKDAGCSYVIVGHSERRQYHGESSDLVRQKATRAVLTGLIPIICIGETAAEREGGQAEAAVGQQLRESLPDEASSGGPESNFLLAYEPVWAIGSGKTPTGDDIRQMHRYIIATAAGRLGLAPERIHVLYGGSVRADNAAEILGTEGVSGVLVGGASLKADEFCKIMAAAK